MISSDQGICLNWVDGFIYFISMKDEARIYRIRPDGTERSLVVDAASSNLISDGRYLYYIDNTMVMEEPVHVLTQSKLDGTEKKVITETPVLSFNLAEDVLFYIGVEDRRVYRVKPDGTEDQTLGDVKSDRIHVIGDQIFYLSETQGVNDLWVMKTDGTGALRLSEDEVTTFNVSGDWIYYVHPGDGVSLELKKMKRDGSQTSLVNDDQPLILNVHEDLLAYIQMDLSTFSAMEIFVKTDGTGRREFRITPETSTPEPNKEPAAGDLEYFEMGEKVSRQGMTVVVNSVYGTNGERSSADGPIQTVMEGALLFINFVVFNETDAPLEVFEKVGLTTVGGSTAVSIPWLVDVTKSGSQGKDQPFFPEEDYGDSVVVEPGGIKEIQAKVQVEDRSLPALFKLLDGSLRSLAAIRITVDPLDLYLTETEAAILAAKEYPGNRVRVLGIFGDQTKDFQPFYGVELSQNDIDPAYFLVDAKSGQIHPGELTEIGVFPPDFGMGSSNDNISNLGYAVRSEEWILFRNPADQGSLYRIRTDGSEAARVTNDRPIFLNAWQGWIYYMNHDEPGEEQILRVRPDGSDRTLVTETPAYYMRIAEDWIYYINITGQEEDPDTNRLFRMKSDGSEQQKITDRPTWFFAVRGETIFYMDSEYGTIRKIYADGSGDEPVSDQPVRCFAIENQLIYYLEGPGLEAGIWRMNLDGTEVQKLSDDFTQGLNLSGGWIYYAQTNRDEASSRRLKRMKTDGSEPQVLHEYDHVLDISLVGDWLFYTGSDENGIFKGTLLRIDGGDRKDYFHQ